jgi:uncharacterized delta-60 repeat protein
MKKILLFLFALATMATQAQNPGDVAQNFGVYPGFDYANVKAVKQQTDGKIIIAGDFSRYKGVFEGRIIRLNADGTKDTSFTTGTGFSSIVNTIEIQADGKILIGGQFSTYNGENVGNIMRLNTDGTKDISFNSDINSSEVNDIEIQTDGKIIVGGIISNRIARLNSDGTIDTSFNIVVGFSGIVYTVAIQADGKILVGGGFLSYNGVIENRIIRLNTNGTKDTTFITGTGFNSDVNTIKIQPDGKILIGGMFSNYKGITSNRIIRLSSNGSKDTTFNPGSGFNASVETINLQTDGKILVGGSFTSFNGITENEIIRINIDGTKDASFITGSGISGALSGTNSTVFAILQLANSKILVGGNFNYYKEVRENLIICLNTDGTKDTTFNVGNGFDSIIRTIKIQTDSKILVGGQFRSYNGVIENRITRLNTDGSKDITFNTGTGFSGAVFVIEQQIDGKILVGGQFVTYNGTTENNIVRLNSDGSKDATFVTGTGFNGIVYSIKQLYNGKILVGGNFTTYNGVIENRMICLNSDGTKDLTFSSGTGFSASVRKIKIQTDGKLVVGGEFTSYNGVAENRIIRLNSDGTKDVTFSSGTGFNSTVHAIEIQDDSKILIGGEFTSYNGVVENRMIRLNSDGSKDATFVTGTGFNGTIYTIVQQTNGKILVGGGFTTYNGVTEKSIITLNTDGTKNTAFIIGTGFNQIITTIVQLADGKILIGGGFTTYKGDNSSAFLIKLHTEQSLSTTSFDTANAFVIYPNPVQNVLHLQANKFTSIKAVKIYDLQGKIVLQDTNETINVSNLSKGLYIVKISTEEGEFTKKFMKE